MNPLSIKRYALVVKDERRGITEIRDNLRHRQGKLQFLVQQLLKTFDEGKKDPL